MRIRLIKKQTIENYVLKNVQSKAGFKIWLAQLKRADWHQPSDIISTFKTADILGNGSDRVVFNIGGNKYRMICKYVFGNQCVHFFICWIGTHSEYTVLCRRGDQYNINAY